MLDLGERVVLFIHLDFFVYNADLFFHLLIFFTSVVLLLLCLQVSMMEFFVLT